MPVGQAYRPCLSTFSLLCASLWEGEKTHLCMDTKHGCTFTSQLMGARWCPLVGTFSGCFYAYAAGLCAVITRRGRSLCTREDPKTTRQCQMGMAETCSSGRWVHLSMYVHVSTYRCGAGRAHVSVSGEGLRRGSFILNLVLSEALLIFRNTK